jgi:glycosyltransferase involved in cell wall biosynthesis
VRILYLSEGYTPHDHRFLTAMYEAGHDPHFLRLRGGARLEPRGLPRGVQILGDLGLSERARGGEWARAYRLLRRVLAEVRPELVHAGPVPSSAFLVALTSFRPLVTMSWGSDILLGTRLWVGRQFARYALSRSTVFLCDCQAVRRRVAELGMPGDRVVVFPWGVDLRRFAPGRANRLRHELGWEKSFILLSARAMEPVYGVDAIVEAFVIAARRDARLRLCLVGDGTMRPALIRRVEAAGLSRRVHWTGRLSQEGLPRYYQAADCYVSASHCDGTSVSLLEAMACARPVIVSDIPGNREWVQDGENGWVFADGDRQELAAAMLEACGNGRQLAQMGSRNREVAEARADWTRSASQMLAAYEMALWLEERQR